jgi:hypothetical protein
VRYRVEGEPLSSGTCHCRTCRKAASAPNLPYAAFPIERFAITDGQPVEFHSSPPVTRSFCGRCGSPLTYRSDEHPGKIDIMTASLDDPDALPPAEHLWVSHKLRWEVIADGAPAYPTTRDRDQ